MKTKTSNKPGGIWQPLEATYMWRLASWLQTPLILLWFFLAVQCLAGYMATRRHVLPWTGQWFRQADRYLALYPLHNRALSWILYSRNFQCLCNSCSRLGGRHERLLLPSVVNTERCKGSSGFHSLILLFFCIRPTTMDWVGYHYQSLRAPRCSILWGWGRGWQDWFVRRPCQILMRKTVTIIEFEYFQVIILSICILVPLFRMVRKFNPSKIYIRLRYLFKRVKRYFGLAVCAYTYAEQRDT